jgi:natural resistance-associated macrophage protein
VANGLNIAADLVAIGSGMQLLHAGPTWLWALVAGILITALLVLGSFARIALVFKLLCAALLSYLVVAVLVTAAWRRPRSADGSASPRCTSPGCAPARSATSAHACSAWRNTQPETSTAVRTREPAAGADRSCAGHGRISGRGSPGVRGGPGSWLAGSMALPGCGAMPHPGGLRACPARKLGPCRELGFCCGISGVTGSISGCCCRSLIDW